MSLSTADADNNPALGSPPLLTVCCVLWGTKYDETYVSRLRDAVRANLRTPHRFVCLSDRPVSGVEVVPIPNPETRYWWSKLYLFQPGLLPGSRFLFLDLDSAIVGPLDDLVNYSCRPGELIMTAVETPGDPPASPVMLWEPSPLLARLPAILAQRGWQALHEEWRGGDQRFITDTLPKYAVRTFPREWTWSYKQGCDGTATPITKAKVIVYHGKSHKPHLLRDGDPFRRVWEFPRAYNQGDFRERPIWQPARPPKG